MAWCHRIYDSIHVCYQVQNLIEPPPGIRLMGCKWVFKMENRHGQEHAYFGSEASHEKFQANSWLDYEETFSLVAMLKSIRILLAIVAYYDYEMWKNGCQNRVS